MLKSFHIRNLTAFAEAELEFRPQLNVIVGENAVAIIAGSDSSAR